MTTERAIEVLQEYVKWFDRPVEAERGILTDEMFNVTEFGKALDKAIEVMGNLDNIKTALENGLYATGNFMPEQCSELSEGIMIYVNDVIGESNEHRQDS